MSRSKKPIAGVDTRLLLKDAAKLLPDPTAEADRFGERVTLKNTGTTGMDLNDWFLRGSNGRVWSPRSAPAVARSCAPTSRGSAWRAACSTSTRRCGAVASIA